MFRKPGKPAFVFNNKLPRVRGIQNMLGEALGELRQLSLQGLQSRSLVRRKIGSGLAEFRQGLAHAPRASRSQSLGPGRIRKGLQPCPELSPERNACRECGYLWQRPVVSFAQRRR